MSTATRPLFFFSIYGILTGLLFLLAPQLPVALFGLPEAPLGWLRVVGMLALIIGVYDFTISRIGSVPLLRASIYVQVFFALALTVVILIGELPYIAFLFACADAAAALGTWWVLRPFD